MIRKFYAGLLAIGRKPGQARKIVFRAVISFGVLAFLIWWLPTDSLVQALVSVSPATWLIVIGGFILGHVVSAFKWRLLLHAVDVRIYKLEAVRAHGAGLFANLCLPSVVGGDLIRAGVVMRDRGKIESIAFGSLADRINDTFALVFMAGVAAFFLPALGRTDIGHVFTVIALTLVLAVVTGLLVLRYLPLARLPEKFRAFVEKLNTALDALLDTPQIALMALLLSIAVQSGFVLLNILLAREIGLPDSYALWYFAWPMAKLFALAPISLGGIGVREAALAGIMAPMGLDAAQVVAQSLSWEAVLIVSGLLSGIIVSFMPGYRQAAE